MGLTAEAKITKASVRPGKEGYGRTPTALVLEVAVEMPAMAPVPDFASFAGGDGRKWQMEKCREEQAKPARPKDAKDCDECDGWTAKGKKHTHSWRCDDCPADFGSEEECEAHIDSCPGNVCPTCKKSRDEDEDDRCMCVCCAEHAAKWTAEFDRARAKIVNANRTAWEATQHAGVFLALVNSPVRMTLEPMQGSIAEMFPLLEMAEA